VFSYLERRQGITKGVHMNVDELIKVLPSSKQNIQRLDYLMNDAKLPRIAVFGTYNHGKSTLLNALVGNEIFKAADKRETTKIKEHEHNGIVWVDTPGLGADVAKEDDRIAKESAFKIADFIFIVHNIQAGELDKFENQLYSQLMRQDRNYKKKLFLFLTHTDQLDAEKLESVRNKIREQKPNLDIFSVSATRYLKGVSEKKQKLIEISGMTEVHGFVEKLKGDLVTLRKQEIKRLVGKARVELDEIQKSSRQQLKSYEHKKAKHITQFETHFNNVRDSIKRKIREN